jgi:nitrogen fixation NifU-like protein
VLELTDSLRQQLITELERARHGFGLGEGVTGQTLTGETLTGEATERTPACGDEVTVRVVVANGVVESLRWQGHGCTVSMASASAAAQLAPGLEVGAFSRLAERFLLAVRADGVAAADFGDAEAFVGIGRFPLRAACAALAWRAALAATAAR